MRAQAEERLNSKTRKGDEQIDIDLWEFAP